VLRVAPAPDRAPGWPRARALQRDPPEGRPEVDLRALPGELAAPVSALRQHPQQVLGDVHHRHLVHVGLVELEHGELGVVARGQALVAEIAVDLVDALEAADHQPLEVQLRRDAQVHVDAERVVVRDERPRVRAAGNRLHHRRLDLEEAARVEVARASR
jgi:hypothetical protein